MKYIKCFALVIICFLLFGFSSKMEEPVKYLYFGNVIKEGKNQSLKWEIKSEKDEELVLVSTLDSKAIYEFLTTKEDTQTQKNVQEKENANTESRESTEEVDKEWLLKNAKEELFAKEEQSVIKGDLRIKENRIECTLDLSKIVTIDSINEKNEYVLEIQATQQLFQILNNSENEVYPSNYSGYVNYGNAYILNRQKVEYKIVKKGESYKKSVIYKSQPQEITSAAGDIYFYLPDCVKNGKYDAYFYTYYQENVYSTKFVSEYERGKKEITVKLRYQGEKAQKPVVTYISGISIFVQPVSEKVEFGIRKEGEKEFKWQKEHMFLGLTENCNYEVASRFAETDDMIAGGESEIEKITTSYWSYSIRYHLDGGTNAKENPFVYQKISNTITLKAPKKAGYIFKGWYTNSAKTKKISKIVKGSDKNYHLYAKWEKVKTPKVTKIKCRKKGKKKAKVSFSKMSNVAYYEIQYSRSKKFSRSKTKTITVKKNSATLKNLKKGKKYYIRICYYVTDSTSQDFYSKYSKKVTYLHR